MDIDSSLVAAFVGALVGGAASLAGSIFVGRRDLTRRVRIQMYQELIPPLQDKMIRITNDSAASPRDRIIKETSPRDEVYAAMTVLHRASVIAGRSDSTKVKALEELCRRQQETSRRYLESRKLDVDGEYNRAIQRLERQIRASALSIQDPARRMVEASEEIAQDLNLTKWQSNLKQTEDDYLALDRSIVEQLGSIYRLLERKIR